MTEESFPRIRPAWFVGGAAVVVVVGLCTLISACAAVGLFWFNGQMSSRDAEVTQVAFLNETEDAAPTVTPRATPTGLPLQATPLQFPTPLLVVSTQLGPASAPDEAVKTYYQLASDQRYNLSWSLLTDTFKQKYNCCAPNYNYTDYVSWWDSVNYVDFGDVHTVSQSGDRAVVYAEMYYVMNSGARSSVVGDPYFELVYDPALGAWRFNDKRAVP